MVVFQGVDWMFIGRELRTSALIPDSRHIYSEATVTIKNIYDD